MEPTNEPSVEEIEAQNKVAGLDGIPGKFFKTGCEKFTETIYEFVIKVWRDEMLLRECMKGVICPLYKKKLQKSPPPHFPLTLPTLPS